MSAFVYDGLVVEWTYGAPHRLTEVKQDDLSKGHKVTPFRNISTHYRQPHRGKGKDKDRPEIVAK